MGKNANLSPTLPYIIFPNFDTMDLNLILNVLLIVFVIVVGTMLTLVLFRAYVIL